MSTKPSIKNTEPTMMFRISSSAMLKVESSFPTVKPWSNGRKRIEILFPFWKASWVAHALAAIIPMPPNTLKERRSDAIAKNRSCASRGRSISEDLEPSLTFIRKMPRCSESHNPKMTIPDQSIELPNTSPSKSESPSENPIRKEKMRATLNIGMSAKSPRIHELVIPKMTAMSGSQDAVGKTAAIEKRNHTAGIIHGYGFSIASSETILSRMS